MRYLTWKNSFWSIFTLCLHLFECSRASNIYFWNELFFRFISLSPEKLAVIAVRKKRRLVSSRASVCLSALDWFDLIGMSGSRRETIMNDGSSYFLSFPEKRKRKKVHTYRYITDTTFFSPVPGSPFLPMLFWERTGITTCLQRWFLKIRLACFTMNRFFIDVDLFL